MRETSTQSFELEIKCIFTSDFAVPARYKFDDHVLDIIIAFPRLVEYLDLLGLFPTPLKMDNMILIKVLNILESRHIKEVMKLQDGSQLRRLIVKACVAPYIESIKLKVDRYDKPIRQSFKFPNDLTEIKDFASNL